MSAERSSAPRPSRPMTPGREFSMNTSAEPARRRADSRSSGRPRSRTVLAFPRFSTALAGLFQRGPSGGSIRMTSAPWSASIMATAGPAMYCPRSSTRTPVNGPHRVIWSPFRQGWPPPESPCPRRDGPLRQLGFSATWTPHDGRCSQQPGQSCRVSSVRPVLSDESGALVMDP